MKSFLSIVLALTGLVAATTSASPSAASTCLCSPVPFPTATNAWYNCPNKICGAAQERGFSNQRCGGQYGDCPAVFIAGTLNRACCNNGYCGLQGNFGGTCDAADTCIQDCLYSSGTPLPPATTYQAATCACTATQQPTTTPTPTGTYACSPTPYYNDQNVPMDRVIEDCETDYHCVTGALESATYACDATNASSVCPFVSYRLAGNNYLSYEHSCCNSQNQCSLSCDASSGCIGFCSVDTNGVAEPSSTTYSTCATPYTATSQYTSTTASSTDPDSQTTDDATMTTTAEAAPTVTGSVVLSTDGTCGVQNNNTVCSPEFGMCCSQYGWCGSDAAHCGFNCQSGNCTASESTIKSTSEAPATTSSSTIITSSSTTTAKSTVSSVSHTSSTTSTSSLVSSPSSTLTAPRSDGRCGTGFGNAACSSDYGTCCSQYSWCGSSAAHCGDGCQNGACVKASGSVSSSSLSSSSTSVASVPGPASTRLVSTDGTCGPNNSNKICNGSIFGDCCSQYGYCGRGAAHCGQGCKKKYGTCK